MSPIWKAVWRFLKKLKVVELPYHPAVPFLGIYLEKTKTLIRKDKCTHMFIAALFVIAETWKQPKCPSTDERIKRYIHNRIFSHKIERNIAIHNNMDGPREYGTK